MNQRRKKNDGVWVVAKKRKGWGKEGRKKRNYPASRKTAQGGTSQRGGDSREQIEDKK